jgi:hypothetical protein
MGEAAGDPLPAVPERGLLLEPVAQNQADHAEGPIPGFSVCRSEEDDVEGGEGNKSAEANLNPNGRSELIDQRAKLASAHERTSKIPPQ